MFYFLFFSKTQKIIDWKKASSPKFCNIIFLFLLKIGSVGPVVQQINLVSPNILYQAIDDCARSNPPDVIFNIFAE